MDASDTQQGSLGDCYFLSALALVATDRDISEALVDDTMDQGEVCVLISIQCSVASKTIRIHAESYETPHTETRHLHTVA